MNRAKLILKCLKQCRHNPYVQGFSQDEHEEISRLIAEFEVAPMANDYIDAEYEEVVGGVGND